MGAAIVFGPNKEGVMTATAGAFGDRYSNISALTSFGIGKASMKPLISQEHNSVSSDLKQECPSEPRRKGGRTQSSGFIGKFEEAVKTSAKGFKVQAELATVSRESHYFEWRHA